jgi:hypothetical protein
LGELVIAAVDRYRREARARRGELFRRLMRPDYRDRILDLGGGDGSHIASIVDEAHITVADISEGDLALARELGYETVLLDEAQTLPFSDAQFDIVFCSSVIEHTTGPKLDALACREGSVFRAQASEHQRRFAEEIRRVGRAYFVQTPNLLFPVESHTWLPFVQFLPRAAQMQFISLLNRSPWPKKSTPDFRLLTARALQSLFPDAEIMRERSALLTLALTKSLIAVRGRDPRAG